MSESAIPNVRPYWDTAELTAVETVIRSGMWTNGAQLTGLETEVAEFVGTPHAVGVSSGTTALWLLLHRFASMGRRRLFVTNPINFLAGPATARLCGYDVAFTDVVPESLGMCPESLGMLLESRRADYDLVVVCAMHYGGAAGSLDQLLKLAGRYDTTLIEDAAHALGARYRDSSLMVGGDHRVQASVFSFHPTKNVASAEGGMVVTVDEQLASALRRARNHNMLRGEGLDPQGIGPDGRTLPWYYELQEPALNLRLSELHAAVARVQLSRLDWAIQDRRQTVELYVAELADSQFADALPSCTWAESAHHLAPIRLKASADDVRRRLFERFAELEIALQVHYTPLYRQPAFRDQPLVAGASYPSADRVAPRLVSLPLYTGMNEQERDRVVRAIRDIAAGQ